MLYITQQDSTELLKRSDFMCKLFEEWTPEIKNYCESNNLSFEKAKAMSQCWSKNDIILQYYNPDKKTNGLLDETPMPIVLKIKKTDRGFDFEQTEYTDKYLSVN